MKAQDFKYYYIISFILTLLIWFILAFLSMGYEEGTDHSLLGKVCYTILFFFNFSLPFWNYVGKFFGNPFIFAMLSIATTSIVFAFLLLLIVNIIKRLTK